MKLHLLIRLPALPALLAVLWTTAAALTARAQTFEKLIGFATGDGTVNELTAGPDGNLYGTTSANAAGGNGKLYRLTTAGAFSLLSNFSNAQEAAGSTARFPPSSTG